MVQRQTSDVRVDINEDIEDLEEDIDEVGGNIKAQPNGQEVDCSGP